MLTRRDTGKNAKLSNMLSNTRCEVLQRLVPCEVGVAKKVQPQTTRSVRHSAHNSLQL